jgi:membrane protease YdiL (CAAX protease family)
MKPACLASRRVTYASREAWTEGRGMTAASAREELPMTSVDATPQRGSSWSRHLRGHLLLFERSPWPAYADSAGFRLLVVAGGLEILRLSAVKWLYPSVPLWMLLPLLLGIALVSVPAIAGVRLSQLGFRRWGEWTTTEKSYFLQVVIIATAFLLIVLAASLRGSAGGRGLARSLWSVFLPYLFFGFYQELVYRGMVQLELVRRWGVPMGILGANVLYTFGPLHSRYFASQASLAGPMFLSIFLIGLFFGVLYRRSGNLWIVACFHAIGNAAIVWSLGSIG